MKKIIAFILLSFFSLSSLSAADEKAKNYKVVAGNDLISLGVFSDWEAFFLQQDNEILCWVSSYPTRFEKGADKAPSSYLMTTVRPMRKIRDEFSFHIPSDFAEGKKVKISVDNKVNYNLDTQGRWAWLRSSLSEERMVISARNGNFLTASYYQEGEDKIFKERFSLSGFTKAYAEAVKKCAPYFHQAEDLSSEGFEAKKE